MYTHKISVCSQPKGVTIASGHSLGLIEGVLTNVFILISGASFMPASSLSVDLERWSLSKLDPRGLLVKLVD